MLRIVRRLLGLWKADREATPARQPELLKRLQVSCVYAIMKHETKSGLIRVRP